MAALRVGKNARDSLARSTRDWLGSTRLDSLCF
jgi:hypothetical protein